MILMNSSHLLVLTTKKRFPKQKNFPRLFKVVKPIKICYISPEEVSDTIKTLNSRKSTGPKIIPVKMMKTIKDEILIPQSNLMNISFNIGIISNICNLARVVPILKVK